MKFNNICHWKKCNQKADVDTDLDYPHIFLCMKHYNEYKKIAKGKLKSFGKIQRKKYLKR